MSTLVEIQDAVARLPSDEKKVLQVWLNSQAEPEMIAQEEERLLHSLDEAIRDIDAGKGVSMDEVRKRVGSCVEKQYSRRKPSRIWSPQFVSSPKTIRTPPCA